MLAVKFILLVLTVLVSYTLGYIFTETKYRLAKYPLFQFKAFECRKCLTTHICWVTGTLLSCIFIDFGMFIATLIFSTGLFLGLYIDEREKTIKVEDFDKILNE